MSECVSVSERVRGSECVRGRVTDQIPLLITHNL